MFELVNVSKRYGNVTALEPLDLVLEAERTYVLLGTSGCGKSTLLKIMLGLVAPDTGSVRFAGQPLSADNLDQVRQRIGYVTQSGGLFPHLSAAANVALVARYLGWDRSRISARTAALAELVQLDQQLLGRYPAQLSGGQQQRVALMRALMLEPAALLLDEPLGALDPIIRSELQSDLREIFRRLNKTVVMVTHDVHEADYFADEILLMRSGRILQQGSMRDLLQLPADPFVTRFLAAQHVRGWDRVVIRWLLIVVVLLILAFAPLSWRTARVKVGSKKFTESVVLGEMCQQLVEDAGVTATHFRELGGTQLVFQALTSGDIDVYPEYTGTITEEILAGSDAGTIEQMRDAFERRGVRLSQPLGFNNTYVLGMLKSKAEELNIRTISDLVRHPDLAFGFGNEFMDRQDGWPNLQKRYDLPQRNVVGLDHDLAYRQLKLGVIDVIDTYATDAKIAMYDLALLDDDLNYFPRYDAVLLYRADLDRRFPQAVESLSRLEGRLPPERMMEANSRVELDRLSESRVAAEFLDQQLGVQVRLHDPTRVERIAARTIEHLDLVRKSLIPAILLAIPLGILAAKLSRFGQFILGVVGVVQTIPSLALLVMLMPLVAMLGLASVGLGSATAVVALLLYSLLPIVRNTHAGLHDIPREHQEAAVALGLAPSFRLVEIELPLAARSILAGIKTAAVINVGFATLGALIGAGGYGQPIITGIRLNDTGLILEGAIPAALLALVVQFGFDFSERFLVPAGLRASEMK